METKDNPLVAITMQFEDGCQLGLRMDHPAPQVEAMAAFGQFAAKVGTELDITLPRQPMDLVMEAIERFLGDQYVQGKDKEEWSSHDMAKAILDAVMMPEPEMAEACRTLLDASQAQHDGLDLLFARLIALDKDFRASESGQPWLAVVQGNLAREKASRTLSKLGTDRGVTSRLKGIMCGDCGYPFGVEHELESYICPKCGVTLATRD